MAWASRLPRGQERAPDGQSFPYAQQPYAERVAQVAQKMLLERTSSRIHRIHRDGLSAAACPLGIPMKNGSGFCNRSEAEVGGYNKQGPKHLGQLRRPRSGGNQRVSGLLLLLAMHLWCKLGVGSRSPRRWLQRLYNRPTPLRVWGPGALRRGGRSWRLFHYGVFPKGWRIGPLAIQLGRLDRRPVTR
jgi:hypothetical protein